MHIPCRFLVAASVGLSLILHNLPVAQAEILNWQTGETIPGTESIDPTAGVDLSGWNSDERQLKFADFRYLDLNGAAFDESWLHSSRFDGYYWILNNQVNSL